jgi:demethylmenaquinone methyltransferase/2-methoxy-6-polyprenyl-1,4-benzoquinol methylase
MRPGRDEDDGLGALLAEQVAYYRARAGEYDATSPLIHDLESRTRLVDALTEFGPRGRVLELACGTGQWTEVLAGLADDVTAVDASPEVLAIAAARVGDARVRFARRDLFDWRSEQRYDVVFFSAWLSHVPPQRFDRFWALVADCLTADGRVFVIDERPAVAAREEVVPGAAVPTVVRPLSDGTRYRAVKVFYEPGQLRDRLTALGWEASAHPVGPRYFYATAVRRPGARPGALTAARRPA